MGYLKQNAPPEEIHLPSAPQETVWMRQKMNHGDDRILQDALVRLTPDDLRQIAAASASPDSQPADVTLTTVEMGTTIDALAVSLIERWTLTDEQDRPLAITLENLALLEPEDGALLTKKARERLAARRSVPVPFGKRSGSPSRPRSARESRRHPRS